MGTKLEVHTMEFDIMSFDNPKLVNQKGDMLVVVVGKEVYQIPLQRIRYTVELELPDPKE